MASSFPYASIHRLRRLASRVGGSHVQGKTTVGPVAFRVPLAEQFGNAVQPGGLRVAIRGYRAWVARYPLFFVFWLPTTPAASKMGDATTAASTLARQNSFSG